MRPIVPAGLRLVCRVPLLLAFAAAAVPAAAQDAAPGDGGARIAELGRRYSAIRIQTRAEAEYRAASAGYAVLLRELEAEKAKQAPGAGR